MKRQRYLEGDRVCCGSRAGTVVHVDEEGRALVQFDNDDEFAYAFSPSDLRYEVDVIVSRSRSSGAGRSS